MSRARRTLLTVLIVASTSLAVGGVAFAADSNDDSDPAPTAQACASPLPGDCGDGGDMIVPHLPADVTPQYPHSDKKADKSQKVKKSDERSSDSDSDSDSDSASGSSDSDE
ncbi:hypothetical protein [Pseudonocardia spinosispora]|uniref:hypothetical protein n=1 Tax=Pseudonocardia spinosispora TaxID=103441 RepID=UPI000419B666|nr:hypothetical protein [Pseudonocardia spinosispora]